MTALPVVSGRQAAAVDIEAVIFDWGGTLTPWRPIDYRGEALALASYVEPARVDEVAEAVFAAGAQVWGRSRDEHRSATLAELCTLAGIEPTEEAIASYRAFWEPATITDPEVRPLWQGLHDAGIRVGVLSNTIWPRDWHREFFERDGVLDLIDGDVYTSEIEWTKPDPRAFEAALATRSGSPTRGVRSTSATGSSRTCGVRRRSGCSPSGFRTATSRTTSAVTRRASRTRPSISSPRSRLSSPPGQTEQLTSS